MTIIYGVEVNKISILAYFSTKEKAEEFKDKYVEQTKHVSCDDYTGEQTPVIKSVEIKSIELDCETSDRHSEYLISKFA